jgi:geranylgeranyl reductase family protein
VTIPEYDVVVVGAGPAGASAARTACVNGTTVLLIDARKNPGSPVQCAEYVPRAVKKYVPLNPKAVVQKIDKLLTFINEELVSTLAGPGYMLDRVVFDRSLVQNAREEGAELWSGTKAISRTEKGLIVSRAGRENIEIKCRVIIGADGPRSTVGQWMNSENKKFMVGLQYNLPLCRYQSSTDIYFKPEYEGGYAWVFPKGERANVGVGVSLLHKDKLPFLIKDFISSLIARGKLSDSRPALKTGGLIPVGGPLTVTQQGNMLLAGDAAGQTHPVTGGGIMNAIVTGQMAGEWAAQAVISNDLKLLSHYHQQWQSFLGRYLDGATEQRKDMDHNWTYNTQPFEKLIRRTWISFNQKNMASGDGS